MRLKLSDSLYLFLLIAIGPGVALAQGSVQLAPLVRVLSSPSDYALTRVSTMGVLDMSSSVTRICIDPESVAHGVTLNCIAIQNDDRFAKAARGSNESLHGRYVQIIATLDTSNPKPRMYDAVFRDVEVLRPL